MKLYRAFRLTRNEHVEACIAFLRSNWQAFRDTPEPLVVEIQPQGAKRSIDQNRRYWSILREISSQCWIDGKQYSDEVLHEYFKQKFIGTTDGPEGTKYGLSSTGLKVAEFADYMNAVEVHAAEAFGWIPE